MRDYGDDEITTYVESRDPMDKAGAYAVQVSLTGYETHEETGVAVEAAPRVAKEEQHGEGQDERRNPPGVLAEEEEPGAYRYFSAQQHGNSQWFTTAASAYCHSHPCIQPACVGRRAGTICQ